MRISALNADGFGRWSGLEISQLSDQLNIFYGPNEAGKTTLLQFVRSVLYGFSPERRARYLPPLNPGRPGGAITAAVGDKTYTVTRHADESGDWGATALVADGEQSARDPQLLAKLLGGVDEPIFNNVFAIGLDEIQELATLSDTQAADELYNLALGLDRVSLVDVLGELEGSRNRLLSPEGRPSLVAQLLSQRERLQGEIDELSQSTVRYLNVVTERQQLDAEIGRLESETAQCEQQARELAVARSVAERWRRRQAIERQLQHHPRNERLPEDALARFDRVESRLAARRHRIAKLNHIRRQLRAKIERLKINESLYRQSARLEALGEQQPWIASLADQVARLETEVSQLEATRTEICSRLGLSAGQSATVAGSLSKRDLVELRATATALRQARTLVRQARDRAAAAAEAAERSRREIGTSLGSSEKSLPAALAEAGDLVSMLRKRVQVDERLDQLARRESELEEEFEEHLQKQMLPTWVLGALGSLFALGCALVLLFVAGLVLPESLSNALGWPVGLVGVAAAAVAAVVKFALEHQAARQLDACQQQINALREHLRQIRVERDQLDTQLPKGGGPLVARLQSAEQALARLEALLPLQSQRDAANRQAEAALEEQRSVAAQYRTHKKRWRQLLAGHKLPADVTPRGLTEYARRGGRLRSLDHSLGEKRQELVRRRAELDALSQRIRQLTAETGVALRSSAPLDQLRQCLAELTDEQSRLKERDALVRHISRLRVRRRKWTQAADRLRRMREALLQAAGTSDEHEFRRRAQTQAEARLLCAEHARLVQEIAGAIAGQCSDEKLAHWLADAEGFEILQSRVAEARKTAIDRLSQARERRGELIVKLKLLCDDRQLSQKRIDLDIVEKRLHDALDRWRVLSVCGLVLTAVRDYYEREHQPPALREASVHLERLTSGRYTRVWTPLGEHRLMVDDQEGHSLSVEVLSRGTREQLFLALRLALVSSYARRGVQLPLVLDDVLVNFDVTRARAAAVVLRDFARAGHQILIFTCHEHIAKLFRNLKAEVRNLPESTASVESSVEEPVAVEPVVEEPTVKRVRRVRAPEPTSAPDTSNLSSEEPSFSARVSSGKPSSLAGASALFVSTDVHWTAPEVVVATHWLPTPQELATAPVASSPPAPDTITYAQWWGEEFDGRGSSNVRRRMWRDRADLDECAGVSGPVRPLDGTEAA